MILNPYISFGVQQTIINTPLFHFTEDQRTNVPVSITTVQAGNADYRWEIRNSETNALVGFSIAKSPTFTDIPLGRHDVKVTVTTDTDTYQRTWKHGIWMDNPKFTEEEADIVVDLSDGNYFFDGEESDYSGLKIYVKGSGTCQFNLHDLQGSAGYDNHVIIQKAIGDSQVVQSGPSGTPHPIYISGNCRYIRFDGYNDDGSTGWKVDGHTSTNTQTIFVGEGQFTDISFKGFETTHATDRSAAAWSFIPATPSITWNASTWVAENMIIYDCIITDSGDEAIYIGYNNDSLQSGYRPFKFRNAIVAWNTITNAGRDGIQPGSCVNVSIHDNTITNVGVQTDVSHESAISWNGGTNGKCFNNIMVNCNMIFNIQSGYAPWDIEDSETVPQPSYFFSNVGINGTYSGTAEPFAIYAQTQNGGSDTANYPLHIFNNTFKLDKKCMEFWFHSGSFTSTNFTLANNVIVRVGDAGDYDEVNFTGPGTQPTGALINNLNKEDGVDEEDILFTDYDNDDLTISSLSSPVYSGSPTDIASRFSELSGMYNDVIGVPMLSDTYTFGAYSGYQKKTVTPSVVDADPATFSTPVSVESVTNAGGTIEFEANKQGALYYVIVANGDTAPTISQILDGKNAAGTTPLDAGQIIDAGTAGTKDITFGVESTAYDLYCVFVTIYGVVQASATKVDYTTSADTTAPVLSNYTIPNDNRDRIYFDTSKIVTASTYGGFTIATPTKTVNGVVINTDELTGHYFTVNSEFEVGDSPTIAYSGTGCNLQDEANTPNTLASFTAVAITNNSEVDLEEDVVWDEVANVSATGNDIEVDSSPGQALSTQIIPADSDGYITFDWDADSRSASSINIGVIYVGDTVSKANTLIWGALLSANENVDVYEGTSYRTTASYRQVDGGTNLTARYRIRVDRSTQKLYFESSINGGAYVSHRTYGGTLAATAIKMSMYSTVVGSQCINAKIQADNGLT